MPTTQSRLSPSQKTRRCTICGFFSGGEKPLHLMIDAGCVVQWGNDQMYTIGEQHWVRRAATAAQQIPIGATVLDLGCPPALVHTPTVSCVLYCYRCGPKMILKRALPPNTRYIPADIKQWNADTIQCDLANDRWPKITVCQNFHPRISHVLTAVLVRFRSAP
jgi:hypothetical protein